MLRLESRTKLDPKLVLHNAGDRGARPDDALARREFGGQDRVDLGSDREAAELVVADAIAEAMAARATKRGRPPHGWIDAVMAGPPPFEAKTAWSTDRLSDFVNRCNDFAHQIMPSTVFAAAAVHLDERSIHCHFTGPAVVDTEAGRVVGWEASLSYMARQALRILGAPADQPIYRQSRMHYLQEAYYHVVGEPLGLERGTVGSTRKHAPTDRAAGAMGRLADEQRLRYEAEDLATASASSASASGAEAEAAKRRAAAAEAETERTRAEAAELRQQLAQAQRIAATEAQARQQAERTAATEADARAQAEQERDTEADARKAAERTAATEAQARQQAEREREAARADAGRAGAASYRGRMRIESESAGRDLAALYTSALNRPEAPPRPVPQPKPPQRDNYLGPVPEVTVERPSAPDHLKQLTAPPVTAPPARRGRRRRR